MNAKIAILKDEKSSKMDLIFNDDFQYGMEQAVEMKVPKEQEVPYSF